MSLARIRRWLSGQLIAVQSMDLLRDWTNIVSFNTWIWDLELIANQMSI